MVEGGAQTLGERHPLFVCESRFQPPGLTLFFTVPLTSSRDSGASKGLMKCQAESSCCERVSLRNFLRWLNPESAFADKTL